MTCPVYYFINATLLPNYSSDPNQQPTLHYYRHNYAFRHRIRHVLCLPLHRHLLHGGYRLGVLLHVRINGRRRTVENV